LVASISTGGGAHAEDPKTRASQLFHEASGAYEHGQFAAAARAFEESDRLVPRAAALYNAAIAWEAAGDPARAAEAYERALGRTDLPHDQAAGARQELAMLSRKLGALEVIVPSDAHVAVGSIEGPGPHFHLYVEPGHHDIRVTWRDGATEVRTIEVVTGGSQVVRFEERATSPREPGPVAKEALPPAPARAPLEASPHSNGARTAGWVILGGSAAFAGAAIVFGIKTLDARNALIASNDTSRSAHDEAVRDRLLTNIAWAGAIGSAVVAGILFVVSKSKGHDSLRTPVAVGTGPGSLVMRERF
jgi:hypothetical protein